MKSPPAYLMYAADFATNTVHLSATAVGAYLRLLNHQWVNGSIPLENAARARVAGVSARHMGRIWAELESFFGPAEKGLQNARLEAEREKALEKRRRRSDAGKHGAERRWSSGPNEGKAGGEAIGKAYGNAIGKPNGKDVAFQFQSPLQRKKEEEGCSEVDESTSKPAVLALGEDELVGTVRTWSLSPEKLSEWEAAYPALDVLAEIKRACQWLRDNPAKRKTAGGMPRFLGSWLARTQNSGRAPAAAARPRFREGPR